MDLNEVSILYNLICNSSIYERQESIKLRKNFINPPIIKVAFDTRRIDQENEYNPRRGLQNYNRSEAFISESMAQKIFSFNKLRTILENLKNKYGAQPEWQDSNARVLLSTLTNGLRINQQDGDFSETQQVQGSLRYIEELLHVRYRLGMEDLAKLDNKELEKIILSKDEELIHKNLNQELNITKQEISRYGYDTLIEKLFTVQATSDNRSVERTITITIKDKIGE